MAHAKTRAVLVTLIIGSAAAIGAVVASNASDGVTVETSTASEQPGPRTGQMADRRGDVRDLDPQATDPDKRRRGRIELTGSSLTSSGETLFLHLFHDADYAFHDAPDREVLLSVFFAPPGHYGLAPKDRPGLERFYLTSERVAGEETVNSLEVTATRADGSFDGRQAAPCAEAGTPTSVTQPLESSRRTTYAIPVDCLPGIESVDDLDGVRATWSVHTHWITSGDASRRYGWWEGVWERKKLMKVRAG